MLRQLPVFGIIDKADLQMKDCDFDKGSVAYKLLDYCDVQYIRWKNSFTTLQIERRVRIKILKDKGLDYANIKIRFFSKKKF